MPFLGLTCICGVFMVIMALLGFGQGTSASPSAALARFLFAILLIAFIVLLVLGLSSEEGINSPSSPQLYTHEEKISMTRLENGITIDVPQEQVKVVLRQKGELLQIDVIRFGGPDKTDVQIYDSPAFPDERIE